MATDKSDNIKVAVRIRGLIPRETESKSIVSWVKDGENCIVKLSGNEKFYFDKVYGITQKTAEIFEELINPIMEDVMIGINGAIFAYGQTSSGKTYTMLGGDGSPGIIHMCINSIFNRIENTPEREYLVRTSYMEIYNEFIVDLLGDRSKSLSLGETFEGEVIVKELQEETVKNFEDCFENLKKGEKSRHYEQTNMNDRSSRSHVIFRVIIESRLRDEVEDDASFFVSQLNLIDLAGSEKAKLTGNTGQRLHEGSCINKSLLTLSQVIGQLSTNSCYISYRDSKLTRILQNSLGGNSKTAFICAVTPVAIDETLSTLRFATKVKSIRNQPIINEKIPESAQLPRLVKEREKLIKELEELKKQLASERKHNENLNINVKEKCNMIEELQKHITVSSQSRGSIREVVQLKRRRETWCPGKASKVMAYQPMIHEDVEDDSLDSIEGNEQPRRSMRISCSTLEPPKIIFSSYDQFNSRQQSSEVDDIIEKYEFEITVKEKHIKALGEEIKKLKKQLVKQVSLSAEVTKPQEDLIKLMDTYFIIDEERVNSMASPIKSLKAEDKLLQTSFIVCDTEAEVFKEVMTQASVPCKYYKEAKPDSDTRETLTQTSFFAVNDEHCACLETNLESKEAVMQTSFDVYETKNTEARSITKSSETQKLFVDNDMEMLSTSNALPCDAFAQTSFVFDNVEEPLPVPPHLDRIKLLEGKLIDAEEKLMECGSKISNYEALISDYDRKQLDYEEQLGMNSKRRKGFEDQIESLRNEVSRLTGSIQSKDLEIEQYKAQMKENENKFDNISDLFANSKIQLDNLRGELQMTNQQHLELKGKIASGMTIQEKQKELIENLQVQLTDALMERNAYMSKLEAVHTDVETEHDLKCQYEFAIESYKKELEALNKLHFEVVDNMEKEKVKLTKELNADLEMLKRDILEKEQRHEELIEHLKVSHQDELENQRESLKLSHHIEAKKSKQDLEALRSEYEDKTLQLINEIKILKEQHAVEIANANGLVSNLQEELDRKKLQPSNGITELNELKSRLEVIEEEQRKKILELEQDHLKEIGYINKLHSEVLEEIRNEQLAQVSKVDNEELHKLKCFLDETRSRLDESQHKIYVYEAELDERNNELKDLKEKVLNHEAFIEKLSMEHKNTAILWAEEKDTLEKMVKDCKRNIELLEERHRCKLESFEASHNEELAVMRSDHSHFIEELKSLHIREMELKLETYRKKYDQDLSILKNVHKDELEHVERQHREKLSQMDNEYQTKVQQLEIRCTEIYKEKSDLDKATAQKQIDELLESYKRQIDECNKQCLEGRIECDSKTSEIKELKCELDALKSSKIAEVELLHQKYIEDLGTIEKLHQEKVQALSSEHDCLLLRIKEIEEISASNEEKMKIQHIKEIEYHKKQSSEEKDKLLKDQLQMCEEIRETHLKQLEELKKEKDDLEFLKCYMEKRFLQLLSFFQIDISRGLAGKTNPTKEDVVDNLFSTIHNFISSKVNRAEELGRELNKANEELMREVDKSSALVVEFKEKELRLRAELATNKSEEIDRLASALEHQKSESMRFKDARDKLLILRDQLKTDNRDLNIKYESLNMLRVSEGKIAEECRMDLAKMKESLEAKAFESLKRENNEIKIKYSNLSKYCENLKEKVMERDETHLLQKKEILTLRNEVAVLKNKLDRSSVATMPAENVVPFSNPQDLSSGLLMSSKCLLANMASELSSLREDKENLEKKVRELELRLNDKAIECNSLRKKLLNERKHNKENAEGKDETRSLEDTAALFARNFS